MRWSWGLAVTLTSSGCHLLFSLDEVTVAPDARLDMVDSGVDVAVEDGKVGACPASYDMVAANGYAYRLVPTVLTHAQAKATCEQDAPGRSDLADLSEDLIRGSLLEILNANVSPANVWVGAVQADGAISPEADWLWERSGQPVQPALWVPPEPNDADGVEDGEQQVAVIASDLRRLRDLQATTSALALCECRR